MQTIWVQVWFSIGLSVALVQGEQELCKAFYSLLDR